MGLQFAGFWGEWLGGLPSAAGNGAGTRPGESPQPSARAGAEREAVA